MLASLEFSVTLSLGEALKAGCHQLSSQFILKHVIGTPTHPDGEPAAVPVHRFCLLATGTWFLKVE